MHSCSTHAVNDSNFELLGKSDDLAVARRWVPFTPDSLVGNLTDLVSPIELAKRYRTGYIAQDNENVRMLQVHPTMPVLQQHCRAGG